MSAGRICVRSVHVAEAGESVRDAARRMREADVGTLFVLDDERSPVGIVTDRDVALRCVAGDRDPQATPVSAVMSTPVHAVSESASIEEALRHMSGIGARRLAVTDSEGRLAGVLALDDVLELLVEEFETIGALLRRRRAAAEA